MFLPLEIYHGGGAPAAFEPLKDHITEYNFALAQYFGAGVQACIRYVDHVQLKRVDKYFLKMK